MSNPPPSVPPQPPAVAAMIDGWDFSVSAGESSTTGFLPPTVTGARVRLIRCEPALECIALTAWRGFRDEHPSGYLLRGVPASLLAEMQVGFPPWQSAAPTMPLHIRVFNDSGARACFRVAVSWELLPPEPGHGPEPRRPVEYVEYKGD